MENAAGFVDLVEKNLDKLSITEQSIFVLEEGKEYDDLEALKECIVEEEPEDMAMFTICVNGRNLKVFIRPKTLTVPDDDEEQEIIKRLSHDACKPIVEEFKRFATVHVTIV